MASISAAPLYPTPQHLRHLPATQKKRPEEQLTERDVCKVRSIVCLTITIRIQGFCVYEIAGLNEYHRRARQNSLSISPSALWSILLERERIALPGSVSYSIATSDKARVPDNDNANVKRSLIRNLEVGWLITMASTLLNEECRKIMS